jgi:hypothetical protein
MQYLFTSVIERHPNLRALLKPFTFIHSDLISEGNRVVNAYIYDYDRDISSANHVVATDFLPLTQRPQSEDEEQ